MTVMALLFVRRARAHGSGAAIELHLESPVSLKRVLNFSLLFLLIQIASTLSERYLGKAGFLGTSVIGGLVSSASTSAASANMVGHGQMQAASALINLPIIHRAAKNPALSRKLIVLTVALSAIGVAVLALQEYLLVLRK